MLYKVYWIESTTNKKISINIFGHGLMNVGSRHIKIHVWYVRWGDVIELSAALNSVGTTELFHD